MDSNNKSNNSNSTDIRANIFLKGLLQRMEEGNLTDKEQNIVHQLKHRYTKENNGNKLSKIELNRAVKRNRQAIAQKTTQSTWNNKRKTDTKMISRRNCRCNFITGTGITLLQKHTNRSSISR